MSSYLTFKIISIAVMSVLLIVVIVKKKLDKREAHGTNATNNVNNPEKSQEVTKTNEHPDVEPKDKVDYNNQMKNPEEKPEILGALKRENRRFMKAYLSMSEWEKNKTRGVENTRTPEEKQAYWEEFERRKKEHYELLKKFPNDQHHCIGFDLPTAAEAFEHFRGMLEELWDYGDMCNGQCLHTWDDGGRKLYRCRNCGGLILVQKSEYHGEENDDYYTDYFPVDSVQEAERLNELYGGWAIEMEWNGKKVFVSNGHVTPYFR